MRKNLRHKSNIKAKFGLFAATSATILAGIGLPASPVSAKVWTVQEIIENKKVLDAEADRLCTDGEGEDYSTDPLCDQKQYEKFVTVDESDPLRTSDRMLLNQRTKEFAERTFTITYIDPANLDIKVYFNDRNYTENINRRITGGTTPEYYLASLELQWLNDRGTVEFSYANALAVTPNQEFTVHFGHNLETDRAKVAPRIAYHGKTMSPIDHHTEPFASEISYLDCINPGASDKPLTNPYREGMVCFYTNADEDSHSPEDEPTYRGYLPDGTLPPAELEPEPTNPGTTTPDGEDHPEGPESGGDGDDHTTDPELGDSDDSDEGDKSDDSEKGDGGDEGYGGGTSTDPKPGDGGNTSADPKPEDKDNPSKEPGSDESDHPNSDAPSDTTLTTNTSDNTNTNTQNQPLSLAVSTNQSTNLAQNADSTTTPKTPNTGRSTEENSATASSTDFLAIAIVAMTLGLIQVGIITNFARRHQ